MIVEQFWQTPFYLVPHFHVTSFLLLGGIYMLTTFHDEGHLFFFSPKFHNAIFYTALIYMDAFFAFVNRKLPLLKIFLSDYHIHNQFFRFIDLSCKTDIERRIWLNYATMPHLMCPPSYCKAISYQNISFPSMTKFTSIIWSSNSQRHCKAKAFLQFQRTNKILM